MADDGLTGLADYFLGKQSPSPRLNTNPPPSKPEAEKPIDYTSGIGESVESLAKWFSTGWSSAKNVTELPGMVQEETEKTPSYQLGQINRQKGLEESHKGETIKGMAHLFLGNLQVGGSYGVGAFNLLGQLDPGATFHGPIGERGGAAPEAVGGAALARQGANEAPKLPEVPKEPVPQPVGAAAPAKEPLPETPSKEYTRDISDALYAKQQARRVDQLESQKEIENIPEWAKSPEGQARIYRYREGNKTALTPDEIKEHGAKIEELRNTEIEELKKAKSYDFLSDKEQKALDAQLDPNYVHRISSDHPSPYDPYTGKDTDKPYLAPSRLPRGTASTKATKYYAIEDAQGNRKIVSFSGRNAIVYTNKQKETVPLQMGPQAIEPELEETIKVGPDGKDYIVKRAYTPELKQHTGSQFHELGDVNTLKNIEDLKNLNRSLDLLKKLMSTPEWAKYTGDKEGYRPANIDVPALKNVNMDPRLAEVFEDIWQRRDPDRLGETFDAINNAYMKAIFLNPLGHTRNIVAWNVLANSPDILRIKGLQESYLQAIDEVKNIGPIYKELLRNGMAGQYARQLTSEHWKQMLDAVGYSIRTDPTRWEKVAKAFGFDKVGTFFRAWSKASSNELWSVNDILLTQRVLMVMKNRGWSMQKAIKDTEEVIPNYRVPTRIADSQMLASYFKSPKSLMFGPYHFNTIDNLMRIGKKAAVGDKDAMARLATLVIAGTVWNAGLYSASDNNTVKRWAGWGPLSIPQRAVQNVQDVHAGKISGEEAGARMVAGTFMPSPIAEALIQAFTGRDYAGREITQKEESGKEQAMEFAAWIAQLFPYVSQAEKAGETVEEGKPLKAAKDIALDQGLGITEQKRFRESGKTVSKNLRSREKMDERNPVYRVLREMFGK